MPAAQEPPADLEPLLNAHQQQLGLVMAEADSIENKALAMLAAAITLLIFIAQAGLHFANQWQVLILIGPYLVSLVCIGCAVWPRHYAGPSMDIDAYRLAPPKSNQELVEILLGNADYAIRYNSRLNQIRWRFSVSAILFLLLGVSVLFAIL